MTRARDFADLAGAADAGTVAGQSLIINGDMAVAQRGTSKTALGNGDGGYHTVDRFLFVEGGSTTAEFTMSQSTEAPDGFGYSLKMECTADDTSLASDISLEIRTRLEGQDLQVFKKGTSNAEKMALSFWVRSDKTGTYTLSLVDKDNSNRMTSKSYSIDTADTWEYKSIIFDGEDTYAFDNDNNRSLDIGWFLGAGDDFTTGTLATTWQAADAADKVHSSQVNLSDAVGNEWYLTGVKLEVGDTATPFLHESYGENLAKCQRYYWEPLLTSAAFGFSASAISSGQARGSVDFPVTMRATPVGVSSGEWRANVTSNDYMTATGTVYETNTSAVVVWDTPSGFSMSLGTSVLVDAGSNNGDDDPVLYFEAEL